MRRLLVLALLASPLLSCALFRGLLAGGFERPRLAYESWSAEGLDLDGVTVVLHYRLENPNAASLDLKRLSYRLEVEGHEVAQGELPAGVELAAQGATPLAIPVRLRWRDVPGFVELLLSRSEVAYRVSGSAGVGSPIGTLDLPFEHRDRVALPRPPSVWLEGVSVHEVGVAQLSLDLRLRIENRNAFPLPVGALTYGLRVGQQQLAEGSHPLVAVPAGGHAVITVPVRVSLSGLAEAVAELLRGAQLRLRGLAGFGGVEVPVDAEGAVRR